MSILSKLENHGIVMVEITNGCLVIASQSGKELTLTKAEVSEFIAELTEIAGDVTE